MNTMTVRYIAGSSITDCPTFIQVNLRGTLELFAVVDERDIPEITVYATKEASSYFTTSGQLVSFNNIVTTLSTSMDYLFSYTTTFNQNISS